MRIGILHQYGLLTSGSGVYAVRLAEALVARGHAVCLISRDRDPGRLDVVDDVLEEDGEGCGTPMMASGACRAYRLRGGVAAVSYPRAEEPGTPTFSELSGAQLRAWVSFHVRRIGAIAQREGLEVLHANHEVPMAYVAREVARRAGIPYMVVAHGSTLEYVHDRTEACRPLTRAGLRGAQRVVALTEELRGRLLAVCPDIAPRVAVVAGGVDLDVFRPAGDPPDTGAPTVAYVGRMSLEKGVHALLAAFPEIARRVPGSRLRLIGEGVGGDALVAMVDALSTGDLDRAEAVLRRLAMSEEEHWLEPVLAHWHGPRREAARAAAVAADLPARVSFTGRLEMPDVAAELRSARVAVVPSLVREAFPLVTLEALASGVPPVAADHAGLAAVLDQISPSLGEVGELLRVPMDPATFVEALAERVAAVLGQMGTPDSAAAIRGRCRGLAAERYSWDRVAAGLEEAYGCVPAGGAALPVAS
jgi:glycosyltransferase involved in cell wall biosynthesis